MKGSGIEGTEVARRNASRRNASRRRASRGPRLRWLALLLFVTSILFCLVVVWHRDSRMHYVAMESTRQVQEWIELEIAQSQHLPLRLPDSLVDRLGRPAIPYPDRDALYRLSRVDERYVLFAGARQGLILPGGDGSPAIVVEGDRLRTVWLTTEEVDEARAVRERLLQNGDQKRAAAPPQ